MSKSQSFSTIGNCVALQCAQGLLRGLVRNHVAKQYKDHVQTVSKRSHMVGEQRCVVRMTRKQAPASSASIAWLVFRSPCEAIYSDKAV